MSDHGKIVMEWVSVPSDAHTYALTDQGAVMRSFYGRAMSLYYLIQPASVEEMISSIRASSAQRVTVDKWARTVPPVELTEDELRKEAEVAITIDDSVAAKPDPKPTAKKKAPAPAAKKTAAPKREAAPKAPKDQRIGARARRLIETGLDLSATRQREIRAAADGIAQKRGDGMTRIWDVYEAAGVKMPANIADEKREFLATGKMPTTARAKAPEKVGRGNAPKAESKTKRSRSSAPKKQSDSQESTPTDSGDQGSTDAPTPDEEEVTL